MGQIFRNGARNHIGGDIEGGQVREAANGSSQEALETKLVKVNGGYLGLEAGNAVPEARIGFGGAPIREIAAGIDEVAFELHEQAQVVVAAALHGGEKEARNGRKQMKRPPQQGRHFCGSWAPLGSIGATKFELGIRELLHVDWKGRKNQRRSKQQEKRMKQYQ